MDGDDTKRVAEMSLPKSVPRLFAALAMGLLCTTSASAAESQFLCAYTILHVSSASGLSFDTSTDETEHWGIDPARKTLRNLDAPEIKYDATFETVEIHWKYRRIQGLPTNDYYWSLTRDTLSITQESHIWDTRNTERGTCRKSVNKI